jgi:hypothetical protein
VADLVSRQEWRARPPQGRTLLREPPAGVKIHYVGGRVDTRIVGDHRACEQLVRSIQVHHVDVRRWADIGYTCAVCPHRKVFAGRGPGVVPAANGPGLNSAHYAVLALLGDEGFAEPDDGLLLGVADAVRWLRRLPARDMPCGREIAGHRDGYPTACPGEPLYRVVQQWRRDGLPVDDAGLGAEEAVPPWPGRVFAFPPFTIGDDVRTWQARMRRRGWRIGVDGVYGPQSAGVCKAFQEEKRIRASGKVNRVTWEAAWLAPIT